MADSTTLAEYFVRLVWNVDNAGTDRVAKILRSTQIQAQLAADAIEKIVGTLKNFSEGVATAYEDLYYASQRNRASVENIKAFGYAAANMGSSVGAARDSIERFGKNLRSNSGFYGVIAGMGVRTKDANGHFRDTVDIMTDLGRVLAKKPEQIRLQFADMFGFDEQTMRTIISPEFAQAMDKYKKIIEAGHFNPQTAAEAWKDFNNTFRDFMTTLDLLVDKVMTRLVKEFGPALRQFVDYLITHSDEITSKVVGFIDSVIDMAKAAIKWIGESSDFQKTWASTRAEIQEVADAVMVVVHAIERLVSFLKQLNQYANEAAKALNWLTGQKGPNGETYNYVPATRESLGYIGTEPAAAGGAGASAATSTPAPPAPTGGGTGNPPAPTGGGTGNPAAPTAGGTGKPPAPTGGGTGNPAAPTAGGTGKPSAPSPTTPLHDFSGPAQTSAPPNGTSDALIAGDLSANSTYARKNEALPDLQGFIVHHTGGGGTPESVVNTLNARGLGVQFVMDRDGKIYRALPKGARAAHILPSEINNLSNSNTEGMEVIAKNDADVTKAQVAAAVAFLRRLKTEHPGLQVFGHGEVNPHHKMASEGKTIVDAFRAAGDVPQVVQTPENASVPLLKRTFLNFAHGSIDKDTPGAFGHEQSNADGLQNPSTLKTAPLTTNLGATANNIMLNQKTTISVDGAYDAHELSRATALSQLRTNGDLLRTMQGAAQ